MRDAISERRSSGDAGNSVASAALSLLEDMLALDPRRRPTAAALLRELGDADVQRAMDAGELVPPDVVHRVVRRRRGV